ncbi:MAG TPA: hypothetical protein VF857_06440, partial [Spirochaetota bacterium]
MKWFMMLLICCSAFEAYPQVPSSIGTIMQVKDSGVIVKYKNADHPLQIADVLYVSADAGLSVLEVIFPMQTAARCRILSASGTMKPGLSVYSGRAFANSRESSSSRTSVSGANPGESESAAGALIDNGDGTITDPQSGLMWTKDADAVKQALTKHDIALMVSNVRIAGYKDWRLP